jgi:hypothetical protein
VCMWKAFFFVIHDLRRVCMGWIFDVVVVDDGGSVVGIGADVDGDKVTGGVGIGSGCVSSGIGSCVSAVRLGVGVGQAGDGGD